MQSEAHRESAWEQRRNRAVSRARVTVPTSPTGRRGGRSCMGCMVYERGPGSPRTPAEILAVARENGRIDVTRRPAVSVWPPRPSGGT